MKKDTKEIICTLGPASLDEKVIRRLEGLGVGLFRINLSHTKLKDLARVIGFIQHNTTVPICIDTEGAQIRTGELADRKVFLKENSIIRIPRKNVPGSSEEFNLYPGEIIKEFEPGDFLSIDFNSVLAQVIVKESDYALLRVLVGGVMAQNKAVTLERDIPLPPLTEKDARALVIAKRAGIHHVALSFASQASDVDRVRNIIGRKAVIISKIESIKGVSNLEKIAAKSDALLIDRGDLSRQIPIEQIPWLQKEILLRARKIKIKVYVATNLLESMITMPVPTRAEVNDIFNTLNDGADGLVLAAETAVGAHPINCATMVSKVINQFISFRQGRSSEGLQVKNFYMLTEPHGGSLINRFRGNFDKDALKGYKILKVNREALLDAEQMGIGTFSPLEGFMNKKELDSVLRNYRLPNGVVWTLPIVLQVKKEDAARFRVGEDIALSFKDTGCIHAVLHLEDIYTYSLDRMALETFGTNHQDHPAVDLLKKRGEYFLAGKIDLIRRLPSAYKHFEMTPRQTRTIFENKAWSRVVGFHTRNVIHRVHEHIQIKALDDYHCDGIFIHPAVGTKKSGDYGSEIILKSYELMIDKYYPEGKAVLGAFQSYSRYSGPREAVFTALCRKNFGCSHFIVGRDHTGVGSYYKSDAAHRLFGFLGDIGITPVFFNEMYFCRSCGTYVEHCRHGKTHALNISGTEGRRMLKSKKCPPGWFMRRDIANLVLSDMEKGRRVFVE